jgi:uncharacterized protein YbjT (DUF2867 family)
MSVECFVTGGTGFIGQHLLANLSAKGHTVRVLMRRPERLAALREQVDNLGGMQPGYLPLLATWSGTTSG